MTPTPASPPPTRGEPARAARTPFIRELEASLAAPLDFPLQLARTGPIHLAAGDRQRADLMFLLAGQAARLCRNMPAAELVATLVGETEATLSPEAG